MITIAGNLIMARPKPPKNMMKQVIREKPIVCPNEIAMKQAEEKNPPKAIIDL